MDDIEVITPTEETAARRMIADAVKKQGLTEVMMFSVGKKMTYADALASMLWQGVVEGTVYLADGSTIKLSDETKMWLDMMKFLVVHIDGGANNNNNFNGVNVFKVYQGIDVDRV